MKPTEESKESKYDFFSVRFLVAVALVLSMGLVGYNCFLMPNYTPPTVVYNAQSSTQKTRIRVNINTATAEELQTVSGIGPVLAGRIVEYRASLNGFTEIKQLLGVSGIGEETLLKMTPYLSV